MKAKISYQDRVEKCLAEGKIWRGKEILQGRIGSLPYDPECLELYGKVLLQMGDTLNAGRILFASGTNNPEYQEAIDLFLSRNKLRSGKELWFLLPSSTRKIKFEKLPQNVQNVLMKRGLNQADIQPIVESNLAHTEKPEPTTWGKIKEQLIQFGILAVVGWIIIALLAGSGLMIKSLVKLLMRN